MTGKWGQHFCNSFLSIYLTQTLDIWYTAWTHCLILWVSISGLWLIHFMFANLVKFFILMVNGRKFHNITASWILVYKCNQVISVFDPFFSAFNFLSLQYVEGNFFFIPLNLLLGVCCPSSVKLLLHLIIKKSQVWPIFVVACSRNKSCLWVSWGYLSHSVIVIV